MYTLGKEPKLQRVKTEIEFKIITGEYPVGERVPSIREIKEMYPIGVAWARIALKELCEEETLVLEQGIGYKVSSQAPEKLMKKYREGLHDIFSQACKDAARIGIDPLEMVQDILDKCQND